ncbi:MAG TPA: DNA polymerase I [Pseudomonadales bacterium]
MCSNRTNESKPLVLVDGSSYLYRAFHALPPLTNSKGQPTGAIKGVAAMLRKLVDEYQPEHMVVVFDAKGKTFRDDLYPEYKAHRPPMPEELRVQIEPLHQLIAAMGLPILKIEGVEADDVIGTLARQAAEQGIETVISTGDKDMAQLVNEHVTLVNTMNNSKMDVQGVVDKFGIPPELIIDYLALIGDTVDNIPGVPKVGPKTALKWLQEYESLEGIKTNADSIKGKVGENLRAALEQLPLSYQLATIKLDVPLDKGPAEYFLQAPDKEALIAHYTELEFKAWLEELLSESSGSAVASACKQNYETILDEKTLDAWIEKLQQAPLFAVDTETTSLNYMQAELVGLSFSVEPGEAAYLPISHDYPGAPEQLGLDMVLEKLKPLLENPKAFKVGQNLKYDSHILARYNVKLQGIRFDTMLESYVLDSTASRHDMDSLALKYLGHGTVHFEDIAGKGVKQLTFNQIPLEQAAPYAAEDADITLRLHQALYPKLQADDALLSVFENIEMPLVPVLTQIEENGALINADDLRLQSQRLAEKIQILEQDAFDIAGEKFNLGSPKQLGLILYAKLNIPVIKKTPKGQPSTAEPVLQELSHDYPLPKVILEHRSYSKLKSTYTDKLPELIDRNTGRIHTSYHQAVAATGRLSSSDPNLQNIPIRSEAGREIRKAFIAEQGNCILAADYSQIELRIMAHLSADKGLLDAFSKGLDIHKATAAEVFSVPVEKVSADQRRNAKAINFGLIYGMSAFGLARQLKIGRNEAQQYIDQYFARYPGVRHYMDNTRAVAAKHGYVETLFGRRLYLPEINASNGMRRQAAERAAINAPMQGTAADIIKLAMISVDNWINETGLDARLIMQVHDELVMEVNQRQIAEVSEGLKLIMESAAKLDVPLVVDVGTGKNWDEAH